MAAEVNLKKNDGGGRRDQVARKRKYLQDKMEKNRKKIDQIIISHVPL